MSASKMLALVKNFNKPGLWLKEQEVPRTGHDDVLIKVHRTAICGTDLHIYNWDEWAQKNVPVPNITGHEFVGEVEDLGQDVNGMAKGDPVTAEGHIVCGKCRNCLAGRKHLCMNTKG